MYRTGWYQTSLPAVLRRHRQRPQTVLTSINPHSSRLTLVRFRLRVEKVTGKLCLSTPLAPTHMRSPAHLAGLFERGNLDFTIVAAVLQRLQALAVIIINNIQGPAVAMHADPDDPVALDIKIPVSIF